MKYFDAHTHVNFAAFDGDREETILRAKEAGVVMNVVGTQKDTSASAVALAEKYDHIYATVGLHPIHTAKSYHDEQELGPSSAPPTSETTGGRGKASEGKEGFMSRGERFDPSAYEKLARSKKVIAIGECGLDYYRCDESTKELQKKVFIEHVELANLLGKPLMLHIRDPLRRSSGEASTSWVWAKAITRSPFCDKDKKTDSNLNLSSSKRK